MKDRNKFAPQKYDASQQYRDGYHCGVSVRAYDQKPKTKTLLFVGILIGLAIMSLFS